MLKTDNLEQDDRLRLIEKLCVLTTGSQDPSRQQCMPMVGRFKHSAQHGGQQLMRHGDTKRAHPARRSTDREVACRHAAPARQSTDEIDTLTI